MDGKHTHNSELDSEVYRGFEPVKSLLFTGVYREILGVSEDDRTAINIIDLCLLLHTFKWRFRWMGGIHQSEKAQKGGRGTPHRQTVKSFSNSQVLTSIDNQTLLIHFVVSVT